MAKHLFKTADVLSVSTGCLLGDVDGLYKVIGFLCGRDVCTHELAFYGRAASIALRSALPSLPGESEARNVNEGNYREWLLHWAAPFGATIELPDSLRECLADDRDPVSTLKEIAPHLAKRGNA